MLIKNTLESSLKSFNDFVPYNMNLLMQQRLPPFVQHQSTPIPQPPPPTPTTVVQPHPEVLAQMIPASEVAIPIDHVLVPLPSPPKSPPPITQPPSTEG